MQLGILFEDAFRTAELALADSQAAKLVFIDQTGVAHVTPEVFRKLVNSPTVTFCSFSRLQRSTDFETIPPSGRKLIDLKFTTMFIVQLLSTIEGCFVLTKNISLLRFQ